MTGLKKSCLTRLAERLDSTEINRWFQPLDFDYDSDSATLRVKAPTVFHQKYLTEKYTGLLTRAAADSGRPISHLRLEAPGRPSPAAVVNLAVAGKSARPQSLMTINPAHSFDRFIKSASNRLALMALEALMPEAGGLETEALVLTASGPWGKSHLLEALVLALSGDRRPRILKLDPQAVIQTSQWRRAAVIIVDDVHFLEDRPDLQQRLVQCFDEAPARRQRLVFGSPKPPHHLTGLGEPLRSRLSGSLVIAIEPPEYELMASLGLRRAAELKLALSEDNLAALVREAQRDPRRLLGGLENVSFLTTRAGLNVQEAVRRLVSSHGPGQRESKVGVEAILGGVSQAFGLKTSDLTGQSKLRQTAWPRRVAMLLARELTGLTTTEIGQALGGRDHSTVIHALKKINEELKNPSQLKMVENIRRSLLMG